MDTLDVLKPDMMVYFRYEIAKVIGLPKNGTIGVTVNGLMRTGVVAEKVFLPSEHVELVSAIVWKQIKWFKEKLCRGATVSSEIDDLFEQHWIMMCRAEGYQETYKGKETDFWIFIGELTKVAEIVNNMTVSEIPFLMR